MAIGFILFIIKSPSFALRRLSSPTQPLHPPQTKRRVGNDKNPKSTLKKTLNPFNYTLKETLWRHLIKKKRF